VQRGSVQFLSLYPGDPSTPGYPSYENSTRLEGASKPTIPSLPISWANAEVLLKHLEDGGEGPTVRLVNNGMTTPSLPSLALIFFSGRKDYPNLERDGCYSWPHQERGSCVRGPPRW